MNAHSTRFGLVWQPQHRYELVTKPTGVMRPTQIALNFITAITVCVVCICDGRLFAAQSETPRASQPTTGKANSSGSWAFQPMVRPPVPEAANSKRETRNTKRNAVDHFILAKLAEKKLSPARPADKATLLRRVTFDLIGSPPAPAELDTFLADRSPDAFTKVVDRLLASPQYGERWARHWLDLARFSESDGFEYDKMREHAWRYRDYLIRSFNEDKPYATFVREQLAGDALAPVTRDGIAGTGFLVAGPYDEAGNTSVSASLKARIREEEMEDVIAAVGQTFLGMTVNCARCHDHKFDPIPQQDYYRLKAALDGVRHGNRDLITPDERKQRDEDAAGIKARIAEMENEVAALESSVRSGLVQARQTRTAGSQDSARTEQPVQPLARWTFEKDANDAGGTLRGTLVGGARIAHGRLMLDGKASCVRVEAVQMELREKTLEAWVALSNLDQQGGGVVSVEAEGGTFDAIVFGERVPKKWMAGSSFFQRTRDLPVSDEDTKPGELVHIAIVYRSDNSIAIYRNGVPYGETYTPSGPNSTLQTFPAGGFRLLFGLRHTGAGNGYLACEIEEARLYDRVLSAEEVRASAKSLNVPVITPEELAQAMTPEQRSRSESLRARLETQRTALKALPAIAPVYAAVSRQPEPTFVLARGDIEKRRGEATAGALSAIPALACDFAMPTNSPEAARRLRLADWMVSRDNPLTWRVMVNRVWHHHFGRGLVATPNDFGVNGERPTHPELLDWLASEFLAQGGSLKKLHRLILLSATYQQSSETSSSPDTDPDNRFLSHFPLRRLEAEAVRDAMLSVSGQLNPQMGGPGFRPFKVTVSGSHFYELIDPDGADFNRRSVYRMNIQSGKDPLLDSLDCPDPSTKTPARSVTTTPIQSLGLMNNAFVQRQCRFFAERLAREAASGPTAQIKLAYRLACAREPRRDELKEAVQLVRDHGMESLCWVLFNSSEFLYVR